MDYGISHDELGTHLEWKHDEVTARMIDWFWSNMEKGLSFGIPSNMNLYCGRCRWCTAIRSGPFITRRKPGTTAVARIFSFASKDLKMFPITSAMSSFTNTW